MRFSEFLKNEVQIYSFFETWFNLIITFRFY